MSEKAVVHVIDDEEPFRQSLGYLLEDAGYAAVMWESGAEFVCALDLLERGCVLLDVRMPGLDGPSVQRIVTQRQLDLPIILLTGHGDISTAVAAMKAGAIDFLEKPFRRPTLLAAVERALTRLKGSDGPDPATLDAVRRVGMLSARELEVLRHMSGGLSNKQMALLLNISPRTVEVHRANLMAKLGVRSLSEAMRVALAAEAGPVHRSERSH